MAKTYAGTVGTQSLRSLYPNVYRVQYVEYVTGRMLNVDKNITAYDEIGARERCGRNMRDIRGGITVEHVATLDLVADNS